MTTLSAKDLHQIEAYWRAANYLSVGQIYLLDNPVHGDFAICLLSGGIPLYMHCQ